MKFEVLDVSRGLEDAEFACFEGLERFIKKMKV